MVKGKFGKTSESQDIMKMIVDFFTDNLYNFNITAKMGIRPVTSVLFHPKLLSTATLE